MVKALPSMKRFWYFIMVRFTVMNNIWFFSQIVFIDERNWYSSKYSFFFITWTNVEWPPLNILYRSFCGCNPDETTTGYYGNNCELFDICLTSPCGAGTCLQDPLGGLNIICLCDELHYGNYCEYEDQCISSPCYNNGQCSRLESGGYKCECPPGYHGDKCFISGNSLK